MLLRPKSLIELQLWLDGLRSFPKIIVFAGIHEPSEPNFRMVSGKSYGTERAFHEAFAPHEVVFVKVPKSLTPVGLSENVYKRITETVSRESKKGGVRNFLARGRAAKILRMLDRFERGKFDLH